MPPYSSGQSKIRPGFPRLQEVRFLKNSDLTIENVLTLMDKMSKTGLGKLNLEDGSFKLSIEAREQVVAQVGDLPAVNAAALAGLNLSPAPAQQEGETAAQESGTVVTSPIVGTFYQAPAPDKPPFVQVGSRVQKGDVLFIVESMKLMNEVLSEYDGTVREILVQDGQPLEYGQPVMVLD